jgi:hypothetical protein
MDVFDCKVMQELTDPELALCRKDKVKAVELKGHGNACFSKREFGEALGYYSQVCVHLLIWNMRVAFSLWLVEII